ncbi:MAG: hypothetical protein NC548_15690 [Lachnospiraceae bacterium]|nr:hypothetical protein [Lachnospiraceae bacterium]
MPLTTKMNNEATEYSKELHIEKAILLEEIILPELPKFVSKGHHSHSGHSVIASPYSIKIYHDEIGKFSIPILTPTNENYSDPYDGVVPTVSTGNITSDVPIVASSYVQSNYIELKIPRYIVLNFIDKIPKLTEFIVAFIGDSYEIDDVKIIGVC